jgi:hypothetical protein
MTKRIGRPKGDGTYRSIGVYGTEQEIAAVLELTPRQRIEAMLATLQDGCCLSCNRTSTVAGTINDGFCGDCERSFERAATERQGEPHYDAAEQYRATSTDYNQQA